MPRNSQPELPPETPAEAVLVIQSLQRLAEELERRANSLEATLEQRIAIEQAKGVLAERLQLPVDECAPILAHAAISRGLPLHGLAQQVVGGCAVFHLRPVS